MGSYTLEPEDTTNEFSAFLAEAEEYDGFIETSDEDTPDEEQVESAGEGPEDGEDAEVEETEEDTEDEGDEPQFEVTLPGGQKAMVPLSELVAGYTRTADYTRKTQALAQQRKDLADALSLTQALERNPKATLEALARAYQVDMEDALGGQDEFLTDEERRLAALEAQVQAQAQERAMFQRQAAIDNEIARLHQRYGDFDEEALFRRAVDTNTMNLEIVVQAMQYETAQQEAAKQAARRKQVKRAAGAVGGATAAPVAKPVVEEGEIKSFRDAYAYAKRTLNL